MIPPKKVKTSPASLLIKEFTDVNSEWLTALLDEPITFKSIAPVGTGLVASTYRAKFEGKNGQDSLIIKLAAEDENSRGYGTAYGIYERECRFYENLGLQAASKGVVPQCWLAIFEADFFTLVMEDIIDGTQGDQVAGLSLKHMEMGIDSMAALHAPFINRKDLAEAKWLNPGSSMDLVKVYKDLIPGFFGRYKARLLPEYQEVLVWYGDVLIQHFLHEKRGILDGLRHVDFRADNILFTPTRAVAVDFQGCGYGTIGHDASYFIGGSVPPEFRRIHEKDLLQRYITAVQAARPDLTIDWDTLWYQYRRQCLTALFIVVTSSMGCVETERSSDMFMSMITRACQQAIDLDVKGLLEQEAKELETKA